MGERKHRAMGKEKRGVQVKQKEEQQAVKEPAEAISRLSANVARPEDVQALQRTIGNQAVTNLIQRDAPGTSEEETMLGGVDLRRLNVWTHNIDSGAKAWVPAKHLLE